MASTLGSSTVAPRRFTTGQYARQVTGNLVAAPVFVLLVSLVPEPYRQWSMALLLGVAAVVYLRHGPGRAEWTFAVAIAVCAVLAAVWTEGRGLLGSCTCCAATVIAAASLAHPDTFAVLPSTDVAFLALLWALAVGLIARGGAEVRAETVG